MNGYDMFIWRQKTPRRANTILEKEEQSWKTEGT